MMPETNMALPDDVGARFTDRDTNSTQALLKSKFVSRESYKVYLPKNTHTHTHNWLGLAPPRPVLTVRCFQVSEDGISDQTEVKPYLAADAVVTGGGSPPLIRPPC